MQKIILSPRLVWKDVLERWEINLENNCPQKVPLDTKDTFFGMLCFLIAFWSIGLGFELDV
jgi:hypothetical protein